MSFYVNRYIYLYLRLILFNYFFCVAHPLWRHKGNNNNCNAEIKYGHSGSANSEASLSKLGGKPKNTTFWIHFGFRSNSSFFGVLLEILWVLIKQNPFIFWLVWKKYLFEVKQKKDEVLVCSCFDQKALLHCFWVHLWTCLRHIPSI